MVKLTSCLAFAGLLGTTQAITKWGESCPVWGVDYDTQKNINLADY